MGDNYTYTRGVFSSPKAPWALPKYMRGVVPGLAGVSAVGNYGLGADPTNVDDVASFFADEIYDRFINEMKNISIIFRGGWEAAKFGTGVFAGINLPAEIKNSIKSAIRPIASNIATTAVAQKAQTVSRVTDAITSQLGVRIPAIKALTGDVKKALNRIGGGVVDRFIAHFNLGPPVAPTDGNGFAAMRRFLEEQAEKYQETKEYWASQMPSAPEFIAPGPGMPGIVPGLTTAEASRLKCEAAGGVYEKHMTPAGERWCRGLNPAELKAAEAKCAAGGGTATYPLSDVGKGFICQGGTRDTRVQAVEKTRKSLVVPLAAAGIAALILTKAI
jgi:hypothetical protein